MDTFVDSSWYFYRYTDPTVTTGPFDVSAVNYWFPIDQYIGGAEHAILHLIYSRFWTKFMRDIGLVKNSEPAERLFTQGMVIKGGFKMSKNRGNVVSPDDMVARYGADSTRMYTLFAAPPDRDLDWQDAGVEGVSRFLSRVYRYVMRNAPAAGQGANAERGANVGIVIPSKGARTNLILSSRAESKDLLFLPERNHSLPARAKSSASSTRPSAASPKTSADAGTSTPPSPPSWSWSTSSTPTRRTCRREPSRPLPHR